MRALSSTGATLQMTRVLVSEKPRLALPKPMCPFLARAHEAGLVACLTLMVAEYWVKHLRIPPKLYLAGLQDTELTNMEMSQKSIGFRLPLNITVYNPNIVSVHLQEAEISGRLQGTEPNIFTTHVHNMTLARRGNTTFTQTVDFVYDMVTDEGMRVFNDLLDKCKKSPTSPPLIIEYSLVAKYTALGFDGVLRQNELTHLMCPLHMGHVTLQGSLDSIHRHSHSLIMNSLNVADEAIGVSMHVLRRSFDLFAIFGGN
ncbi:hypothetical protein GGI12_001339 [Dipsacomyces acuminosporus]|nr:hypothetical protein GGI12_001339 [Dipsacomyces acuminosporus]